MIQDHCISKIAGTGSCLPLRKVSNKEIARRLRVQEDYVFRMTGIHCRYWVGEGEQCSSLGERAARQALHQANLSQCDVDAIIVSTTSPDMLFPSTACHIQRRLGLPPVAAFDIAASCSGFLYGLSMADCFIRSGQFQRCLVVAAEVKSRYLDPMDQATAMLFGDGAGAAVVVRAEDDQQGILDIRLFSDGTYHNLITVPAGGSRLPMSCDTIEKGQHTLQLQGSAVFRVAVKRLGPAIREQLDSHNLTIGHLAHVIFHQANARLMAALARRLEIAPAQLFSVIDQIGNASSASLPIALDMANRQGRLQRGDLTLLGAFGGGLTWGTGLIRWG